MVGIQNILELYIWSCFIKYDSRTYSNDLLITEVGNSHKNAVQTGSVSPLFIRVQSPLKQAVSLNLLDDSVALLQ